MTIFEKPCSSPSVHPPPTLFHADVTRWREVKDVYSSARSSTLQIFAFLMSPKCWCGTCCSPLICIWRSESTKWCLFSLHPLLHTHNWLSAPLLVSLRNDKVLLWTVSVIPAVSEAWLCPSRKWEHFLIQDREAVAWELLWSTKTHTCTQRAAITSGKYFFLSFCPLSSPLLPFAFSYLKL